MIQLSVVILTKNEEHNIARTLNAISTVADEVIIMDSGSVDKTREICEGFAEKRFEKDGSSSWLSFIETHWLGFGPTKNAGISRARFKFILSLDADEELSEMIIGEIQLLKKTIKPDSTHSYAFNRLTKYGSHWVRHSGWYPDWHTRIFSKDLFEWNDSAVHERLIRKVAHRKTCESNVEAKAAPDVKFTDSIKLQGPVYHYSYKSIEDHIQKLTRYAHLGASQAQKKPWPILLFKMVFNPPFRFIRVYFFNLGILDGWIGLVISVLTTYGVFLKYFYALKNLSSKN